MLASFFASTAFAAGTETGGAVGMRRIEAVMPETSAAVPIMVRYPTEAAPHPVRQGPYGLVLIAHGSRGSYIGHRDTAMHLARNGFIVAAVLHPGDN